MKVAYTKQQQLLADQLYHIYETEAYFYEKRNSGQIPWRIILEKCAVAFNVPVSAFKGKIVHNNKLDKTIKYCFLLACEMFGIGDQSQEIKQELGYTTGSVKDYYWCSLSYTRRKAKYALEVLHFFKSLVDYSEFSGVRFYLLVDKAESDKSEKQKKVVQHEEKKNNMPTLQDYYDLMNENIKHMQQIVDLKLDKGIPFNQSEDANNKHVPIWQKKNFVCRRLFDALDSTVQYEFVHISSGTHYVHPHLVEWSESLFEDHRN